MRTISIAFLLSLLNFTQINSQIKISNLETIVDSIFEVYNDQPGGLVGIVKEGEILFKKAYGFANLDYNIASSEKSVHEIGSMAMHMTAACILSLEYEGKLDLNASIQSYLTDFPKYDSGDITVQNLLNHTGGIKDYIALIMSSGKDINANHDQHKVYDLLKRQTSSTIVPGSEYRYSNSGYMLLALIVEKVSGTSFPQYISERFFEPFGMKYSFVYSDKNRIIENRSIGYESKNDELSMNHNFNYTVFGDGRIYTTLEDMLIWAMSIKKERLGVHSLYELLINRGVLSDGTQMTYANGLEFATVNGHKVFGHSGYFGAFSSMIIDCPDLDISIVTLTNNAGITAPGKAYEIADRIFADKPVNKSNSQNDTRNRTKTLNNSVLNSFTGDFFSTKYGYIRSIKLVDDTLHYIINENVSRKLVPISENEFKIDGIPTYTSFRFSKSEDVHLRIQIGENAAYQYTKFEKVDFESHSAKEFLGNYYSKELEVNYEIKTEDNLLKAFANGKEIASFQAIMKDHFTSAHDGYLAFTRKANKIYGFAMNDYSLGVINFKKIDKEENSQ